MDFSLSEEQELFRNYVRKSLQEAGGTDVAREFIDGNTNVWLKLKKKLTELGCTSINISEEYGGAGLQPLDLVPVFEEFGRVVLPGPYLETIALVVPLLEKYGTEEQKNRYLPRIADGTITFSVGWLEPYKSYNPDVIACQAIVEGDKVLINGTKTMIPYGNLVDGVLLVVRTSEGKNGEGLSLILVESHEIKKAKELSSIDETKKFVEITLDNMELSTSQIVGKKNQGWEMLQDGLFYLHAAISSVLVGSMERMVEMATDYANIREQFGQPIGRFQAIKHRIVDMKLDLEIARSLSHYANWALETNQPDKEAAIYCARAFATEVNMRLASDNIQIHGGIGVTMELDCQLFLKRARFYENYMGSIRQFNEEIARSLSWINEENRDYQIVSEVN